MDIVNSGIFGAHVDVFCLSFVSFSDSFRILGSYFKIVLMRIIIF